MQCTIRNFLKIKIVPPANRLYRFSIQFFEEQFIALTNGIINALKPKRNTEEPQTIIIYGTALSIDLNGSERNILKWIQKIILLFRIPPGTCQTPE